MLKPIRLPLLSVCLLALPLPAQEADAALAAQLVGEWEGRWEFEKNGGRLTAKIRSGSGNSLKGETTWYATVVGDFNDSFTSAKVKGRKLTVREQTMDFEVTVSEDGTTLEGTWTSPVASGPMKLLKKAAK
ncbi:MAG: hypothetical protein HY823_11535 [Acidobacteria bacterium]|nr:hypothetical protein [Acidobacteriota bacterium]